MPLVRSPATKDVNGAKNEGLEEEVAVTPCHPGLILREVVLPALNLSVSQARSDLAVARQTLHRIFGWERRDNA
jgi:hypothetical protein